MKTHKNIKSFHFLKNFIDILLNFYSSLSTKKLRLKLKSKKNTKNINWNQSESMKKIAFAFNEKFNQFGS